MTEVATAALSSGSRIDAGVDVIIQKLNLTAPNLREETAVEKVMTKLEVIKEGIEVRSFVREIKSVTDKLDELFSLMSHQKKIRRNQLEYSLFPNAHQDF